jgi:hypothetical protein
VNNYIIALFALFLASIYGLATSNILIVGLALTGYYVSDHLTQE